VSPIGGTPGNSDTGRGVVTPSATNCPDWMNGRIGPRLSMVIATRPAITSCRLWPVPL
jgi:hypothetical protein